MTDDRWTYVESTIIMTTVRVIAPFVMTFGLFVTLHGADSPGGGFQGGVILASVVVMLAFAFGAGPTREWVSSRLVRGLVASGVAAFVLTGLGSLALGEAFLQYTAYGPVKIASKYGIEFVELGIGATVVGVVTSVFFLLERGWLVPSEEGGEPE